MYTENIGAYIYAPTCVCAFTNTLVVLCVHIHTQAPMSQHTHTHVSLCAGRQTDTQTHTHKHTHTHTHTTTHTHTHKVHHQHPPQVPSANWRRHGHHLTLSTWSLPATASLPCTLDESAYFVFCILVCFCVRRMNLHARG
jgi:hypothetical protein